MGFPWSIKTVKEMEYHDDRDPNPHHQSSAAAELLAHETTHPFVDLKSRQQLFIQRCVSILLFLMVLGETIALYRCKRHLLVRQTPVPDFMNVERTWVPDQRFAHKYMFSDRNAFDEVYRGWDSLFPSALGMIHIDHGQSYIENPPYQTTLALLASQDAYMVTGIHQLHCLRVILSAYGALRLDSTNEVDDAHLAHCFDYLRQGLMCSVDTSLEGNSTEYGEGWGSVHVCKDYSKVVNWIDHRTKPLEIGDIESGKK